MSAERRFRIGSMSSPHPAVVWSLTDYFPSFGGPEYLAFKQALAASLAAPVAGCPAAQFEAFEEVSARLGHLSSYLSCLSSADATNEAVKADEAWLAAQEAESSKWRAALQATLAALGDADFSQLLASPQVAGAEWTARRMREEGTRQMTSEMEALAADLNVDGLCAWGRLYETVSGKLTFPMTFPDGHVETVPMARRRALMADPERAVREAAFRDGQQPWLEHADTFAAALNGIAGSRLTLYRKRGIAHYLDAPLTDGGLTRAALDAMLAAIHEHIELPRRALRTAGRLQGTDGLHFFDVEAPQIASPDAQAIAWPDACGMVRGAFHSSYPALGAYFDEMLANQWIEAEARAGKRPGAFCTGSHVIRQERVYMTYHDTIHDVVTLAHEVGHAWHSAVLRPRRTYATQYPMTLAETASNFGEMILLDGLLSDPALTAGTRAWLLDQEALRAHSYLVNIPMRYEFESRFYEERQHGEVTVSRLGELMTAAQHKLYGDTLVANGTDPMFWASKMHFFITGVSFYNFPYVFGYLLSRALFARFKEEGVAFLPQYEEFLALTGSASCEEVVRQTLGDDITRPEFWARSITALEPTIAAYEAVSR
jgi:oligoendopeptidase F